MLTPVLILVSLKMVQSHLKCLDGISSGEEKVCVNTTTTPYLPGISGSLRDPREGQYTRRSSKNP